VHMSHLWLMGSSCGIVVNVADLLVAEASRAAMPRRRDRDIVDSLIAAGATPGTAQGERGSLSRAG
jgi:hypothetical protein